MFVKNIMNMLCQVAMVLIGGDINNCFVVAKTSVSYITGHSYPDGGSGEIQSVDICPKCFSERVVPFFLLALVRQ